MYAILGHYIHELNSIGFTLECSLLWARWYQKATIIEIQPICTQITTKYDMSNETNDYVHFLHKTN